MSPHSTVWPARLIFTDFCGGIAAPVQPLTQAMQRSQIVPGFIIGSGCSSASVMIAASRCRGPKRLVSSIFDHPISPRPAAIAAMRMWTKTSGAARPSATGLLNLRFGLPSAPALFVHGKLFGIGTAS